jgi:hypothetical protein
MKLSKVHAVVIRYILAIEEALLTRQLGTNTCTCARPGQVRRDPHEETMTQVYPWRCIEPR